MATLLYNAGTIDHGPVTVQVGFNETTGELVIEMWRQNWRQERVVVDAETSLTLATLVLQGRSAAKR